VGGLLLSACISLCLTAADDPASKTPWIVHVSPQGDDRWSGQLPTADAEGADGPVATLERARDLVRAWKRGKEARELRPVEVIMQGGTYYLTRPLLLTQLDSGTTEAPVTYRAAAGAKPVISGGRRLTGWQRVDVSGKLGWLLRLPEVREGRWRFQQLWVDGERAVRARHPNSDYLVVEEVPEVTKELKWSDGQGSFRYKDRDLWSWRAITNAELRVMNRWKDSHLPVLEVDESRRIVRFGRRTAYRLDSGDPHYVENVREALDRPGEWYLDQAGGLLVYLPVGDQDMETTEVIAPVLSTLVRLSGLTVAGTPVQHLHFEDLTFMHTDWEIPKNLDEGQKVSGPAAHLPVGALSQASIEVPAAVHAEGVRECRFHKCQFVHLGGYAIELALGCQENLISRCEFADLGAGGVKLGETPVRAYAAMARDNEISDCHFRNGGRVYHSSVAIWVGQSPGNRVLHNHIHDFHYTGISLGWTWGYGRSAATNLLVAFNHVHHLGRLSNGEGPILSDLAGIYTLGMQKGTVLHNNFVHDIAGRRYGGWGIYFDEGTTSITATSNLVVRTTHGGFHQHYGRENTVRNNIFVDARDMQLHRTREESHRSFTFENNIVSWRQGTLIEGRGLDRPERSLFRRNLYGSPGGKDPDVQQRSWRDWRASGQDDGSEVGDPGFVAPDQDDYRLRPNSPALKLGFAPLDLGSVGVRPE